MGRLGMWTALLACWLAGGVLGVAGVALRTEVGRDLVTRTAVSLVNGRINGTLTIGDLDGSFFEGLEARDIAVVDPEGGPVLELAGLRLRYRLGDLLSRRVVLGQLVLERPTVHLTRHRPGGPFTLETLLPPDSGGAGGGGGGPSLLVAFNDVEIRDGSLIIATLRASTVPAVVEGEADPEQYLHVQRIEGIAAAVSYLRLSSPRPEDRGLYAEIASLRARISDPAISVAQIRGTARLAGDSLTVDLGEVRLSQTQAGAEGVVVFASEGLLFDLSLAVDRAATDEIRPLISELPAGLLARGAFQVGKRSTEVVEVDATDLEIEGLGGGGHARGHLGFALGPGGEWTSRNTSLDLQDFDLEYVRGFLGTLPVAGRVTGSVKATGPRERLGVELDVVLRDSLVPGWPHSVVRGGGDLLLGGDLTFEEFYVEDTDLDLGTLQRLLPAIALRGRLQGRGTLNGPLRELRYNGELRHRDPPGAESVLRGTLRIDARRDPIGVWGDVLLDSLRLAGLQSSFPAIPSLGTYAGRTVLAGHLDSLAMQARLGGPAGHIALHGALIAYEGSLGAHQLVMEVEDLNLAALQEGLPQSAVNGEATVSGVNREGRAPRWSVELSLQRSRIQDVPLDSARGSFALADTLMRVDTLLVWSAGVRASGQGAFGVSGPRSGTLTVTAAADSVGVLEPLLVAALGEPDSAFAGLPPAGTATVTARLVGSLDAYSVTATFDARELRRADAYVSRAAGSARWRSPFDDAVVDATIDSVMLGALAFSGVEARVAGRSDSLSWFGRARFGSTGSWIGGGRLLVDSTTYLVPIDSMAFLLTTGAWFVDSAATVAVSDSGVDFRSVHIAQASGASRVMLEGRLPFRGPADLRGSFQAVSLSDVSLVLQKFAGSLDGELSGTLRLGGTARAPTLHATGSLRDGVFYTLQVPYLDWGVNYTDQHLDGDFSLWRRGERFVEVNVSLPLDLALTSVEQRQLPGPLMVRAVADSMPLSFVEAILPVMRRASGTLTADVGIRGSWDKPELTGRVSFAEGAASFPAIGVRYERLNGALVLSGETIRVEHLSLRSGRGAAEVTGSVRLQELTRPVLDLRISGRDFHAVNVRDFLSLSATAELELKGPPLGATLTGSGTATRGVIYFADLITKRVINLDDTLFASLVDRTLIREERLGTAWQQRFLDSLRVDDLRIQMGNDVWLRSSEANIQLAGEITVNKLRKAYRINGTLQGPRGSYRLPLGPVTRDFTVTRGEVRYFGTPDLNADIDIDARHNVRTVRGDDVTVLVHIGGTLYDPRLTLSSDIRPPPSQAEIISYLLIGAPSVQAAAENRGYNQGISNQAVSQLAGVLSGQLEYALISDLGVPLDLVQIRPGDIGSGLSGTEIAIGKQFNLLGTTAFLTASQRVCPHQALSASNTGASLEFRLTRHWLFAASADPLRCGALSGSEVTYQFGLDILWEKSY